MVCRPWKWSQWTWSSGWWSLGKFFYGLWRPLLYHAVFFFIYRGMYIARQLSFSGVTFDIKEIPMDPEYCALYDDCVALVGLFDLWSIFVLKKWISIAFSGQTLTVCVFLTDFLVDICTEAVCRRGEAVPSGCPAPQADVGPILGGASAFLQVPLSVVQGESDGADCERCRSGWEGMRHSRKFLLRNFFQLFSTRKHYFSFCLIVRSDRFAVHRGSTDAGTTGRPWRRPERFRFHLKVIHSIILMTKNEKLSKWFFEGIFTLIFVKK